MTGLEKGQDYYVRVYAYNSQGYSEAGLPEPHFHSALYLRSSSAVLCPCVDDESVFHSILEKYDTHIM